MARVLAISSQVVRGHIGLSAIVPALQTLGHEVWALPTIVLSNHPGHRNVAGVRTSPERLEAMLDALGANDWLAQVDAVVTGYLPSPEHVAFAARAIGRVRMARPDALVLVDPVLGDEPKGLYIAAAAAALIRDTLVPLADVATPNRFEMGWLTGRSLATIDDVQSAAGELGLPSIVVTSALGNSTTGRLDLPAAPSSGVLFSEGNSAKVVTLLLSAGRAAMYTTAHRPDVPHGTGDLFSALLMGHLLRGQAMTDAVARSVAGVACAIEASIGRDELVLSGHLRAICEAAPSTVEALL